MVHYGIADKDQFHDLVRINGSGRRRFLREAVDGLPNCRGHFGVAAGVQHRVAYPAHEVLAEPDLRIHGSRARDDVTAAQVAEMRRYRGGPQIDGKTAQASFPEARTDVEDALVYVGVAAMKRDGDRPLALA